MADSILHIKDAYYFDVPKFLWRADYQSLDEVPEFLRDDHPHATLDDFNHELSGKVLLYPQPFGELDSLYHKKSGFCVSKFMIIELVVAFVMVLAFSWFARRIAGGERPRGRMANLMEAFLAYLREHVAEPAIGHHDADRFVPLLWTMFFFILFCNLCGLLPWSGNPTGEWAVTGAMALVTFLTVLVSGTLRFGVLGFWKNQVPSMDLPLPLAIFLKPMIFAIEVLGLLIKHAILSIRLLANMVAGHLVLLAVLGMAVAAAEVGSSMWPIVAPISVIGSALFSLLELMVAFLQAYIFTFLSALFIGAAVHHH